MLIDTHCHLAFKAFDNTWEAAVSRARQAGVQMIAVGAAQATSEKSLAIAQKSDSVFAAVGLHPTHVEDEDFDEEFMRSALTHEKAVAVGETGIDHYHIEEARKGEILKKQEELLAAHIAIAKEHNLPVILHSRDGKTEQGGTAYAHLLGVIKECDYSQCVLHCYGGDWKHAKQFLDFGTMLSFTGIVSFKNISEELRGVVKKVPMDRMMIETDSPYLAPEPYRRKENEPRFVEYVARAIAEIKGLGYAEVAQKTTENAQRFFKLPSSE